MQSPAHSLYPRPHNFIPQSSLFDVRSRRRFSHHVSSKDLASPITLTFPRRRAGLFHRSHEAHQPARSHAGTIPKLHGSVSTGRVLHAHLTGVGRRVLGCLSVKTARWMMEFISPPSSRPGRASRIFGSCRTRSHQFLRCKSRSPESDTGASFWARSFRNCASRRSPTRTHVELPRKSKKKRKNLTSSTRTPRPCPPACPAPPQCTRCGRAACPRARPCAPRSPPGASAAGCGWCRSRRRGRSGGLGCGLGGGGGGLTFWFSGCVQLRFGGWWWWWRSGILFRGG